jgi:hypothetical protein
MAHRFKQVGMIGGNPSESVTGTRLGDRTFITIETAIMADLKEE